MDARGRKGSRGGPHKGRRMAGGVTTGRQGTALSHPLPERKFGEEEGVDVALMLLSHFNATTESLCFCRLNARGKKKAETLRCCVARSASKALSQCA